MPGLGTYDGLVARHAASRRLYGSRREGRSRRTAFSKPANAPTRLVAYGAERTTVLYDIVREPSLVDRLAARTESHRTVAELHTFPTRLSVAVAERVRDALAERLSAAFPDRAGEIERILRGVGAGPADKPRRPSFLPLPSIGHTHAHHGIRRVAVHIPPDCPMPARDIAWGLQGLDLAIVDPDTGELRDELRLVGAESTTMLGHYNRRARPALAQRHARRAARRSRTARPQRRRPPDARGGGRARHRRRAAPCRPRSGRRHGPGPAEPFHRAGTRADRFAAGRFTADRLTHAELVFPAPVEGPLVLGDGRFLGLGLFVPLRDAPAIQVLTLDRAPRDGDRAAVVDAFRRAVMAVVGDELGERRALPLFFSGHDADGKPSAAEPHDHVFLALDPTPQARLLVISPERVDRRPAGEARDHAGERATLEAALDRLTELRAGRAGAYRLGRAPEPASGDPLIGPSRRFVSATPYRPMRHPGRHDDPAAFVAADAASACRAFALPQPEVEIPRPRPRPPRQPDRPPRPHLRHRRGRPHPDRPRRTRGRGAVQGGVRGRDPVVRLMATMRRETNRGTSATMKRAVRHDPDRRHRSRGSPPSADWRSLTSWNRLFARRAASSPALAKSPASNGGHGGISGGGPSPPNGGDLIEAPLAPLPTRTRTSSLPAQRRGPH